MYRVVQKNGATGHRLMTTILSILNWFKNMFFTGRFVGKFAVKGISKTPPHLAYVATLLCETSMSAKQTINDQLQGSVAAFSMCAGIVNNQINKGLLLSLWVQKLQLLNIWQSYPQERILSRALWLKGGESAWNNLVLACNFAKYSPIYIFCLWERLSSQYYAN